MRNDGWSQSACKRVTFNIYSKIRRGKGRRSSGGGGVVNGPGGRGAVGSLPEPGVESHGESVIAAVSDATMQSAAACPRPSGSKASGVFLLFVGVEGPGGLRDVLLSGRSNDSLSFRHPRSNKLLMRNGCLSCSPCSPCSSEAPRAAGRAQLPFITCDYIRIFFFFFFFLPLPIPTLRFISFYLFVCYFFIFKFLYLIYTYYVTRVIKHREADYRQRI